MRSWERVLATPTFLVDFLELLEVAVLESLALDFDAVEDLLDFADVFDEIAEAAAAAAARLEVRVRVILGGDDSLAAEGSREDCELREVAESWSSWSSLYSFESTSMPLLSTSLISWSPSSELSLSLLSMSAC